MPSAGRRGGELVAYALALAVGVPVVLAAYSGLAGYAADDFWQLAALREGVAFPGGPTADDLFRLFSGDPAVNLAAMREGALPWYTDPSVKLLFWRPLSSTLHRLDYALFGVDAGAAKAHSLLWYLALVAVVGRLFRRVLPAKAHAPALVVFAVAASHWQIVSWISARNALVTAVFATASLLFYLRWRLDGRRLAAPLSFVSFVLGLSAGEAALGVLGYIVAFELCWAQDGWGRRSATLALTLVPTLAWLGWYAAAGYGAHGSGAYITPADNPVAFVTHLPERLLAMVGMSFLGFPSDLWFLHPSSRPVAVVFGAVSLVVMVALLRAIERRQDHGTGEHRLWLTLRLGALLAMVPQAAGLLGARSLTLPSVGTSALLGLVLARWRLLLTPLPSTAAGRAAALHRAARGGAVALLALINLVLAPLVWFGGTAFYSGMAQTTAAATSQLALTEADLGRHVLVVQPPDAFLGRYLPFQRRALGLPTPRRWHVLSIAPFAHRLTRPAADTLVLEVVGGQMMTSPFEQLFRDGAHPLEAGDAVDLGDLRARVLEVGDQGPTRVEFRFTHPVDDPSYLFLAWQGGSLGAFAPPPVGGETLLPWVAGPINL